MNRKKIVFVLGKYPDPRLKKRINSAKKIGKVSIISWDMRSVNFDYIDEEVDFYPVKIKANRTNPLKRILPTFKFIFKAEKKLFKLSPDILHVENIDMLLVASIYYLFKKNKPMIIYEVADLHRLVIDNQKSIPGRFIKIVLRKLERCLCKKISILIITSEKFYDVYYSNFVDKNKVVFMPNMPDLKAFSNYKKKTDGKFTIGFIGNIRYKEQMKLLINSTSGKDVNVLFAGFSYDNEIELYCSGKGYVKFYGKYNYDRDISNIYGQVDCVYAVYDADNNNVKVALPNKLYESIYCELPIIVAKNTYLSELVENMGVGVAVSHKSKKELEEAIEKLANDKDYYGKLVEACQRYKKDIDYSKYDKKLLDKINGILETRF